MSGRKFSWYHLISSKARPCFRHYGAVSAAGYLFFKTHAPNSQVNIFCALPASLAPNGCSLKGLLHAILMLGHSLFCFYILAQVGKFFKYFKVIAKT